MAAELHEVTRPPREPQAVAGETGRLLRSSHAINGLVHLYRGELGRMTAYRARLDTTTNWAITTTALSTTFALGSAERSHAVFLSVMAINYFFLHLEAKRFQAYETSRHLVQLLERSFYPEVLGQPVNESWTDGLMTALRGSGLQVNYLGALGWRLRRTYVYIFSVILLAWLSKLDVSPGWIHLDFVSRAAVGSVPGWAVAALVTALYGWVVWLTAFAERHYCLGDVHECD